MVGSSKHASSGTFRIYLPVMDHLAARGVDVPGFLAGIGLPGDLASRPETRLRRDEQESIWRGAIELTGDPLLPARVARDFPLETIGLMLYLARVSASGVDAVQRVRKLVRLIQDEGDLELEYEPGLAVLHLRSHDPYTPSLPMSEFWTSLHVFVTRRVDTDRPEPRELRIPHHSPPHAADFEAFVGVPVRYRSANVAVAFSRSDFDRPLRDADAGLRELLEDYARELLARLPPTHCFAERVRAAVAPRLPRGSPRIEEIAAELRMSARSVRRNLEREGTSYRATVDALRRELALRALECEDASIDGIALELGFSDPSAFYKAFRRWTGRSPRELVGPAAPSAPATPPASAACPPSAPRGRGGRRS